MSCSETGSTSGPSVVMLAFSEYPAIAISSLLRCTPTCTSRVALGQFVGTLLLARAPYCAHSLNIGSSPWKVLAQ